MNIPNEVKDILTRLQERGFLAYIVGGSVRDLMLNKNPNDWDITTNALPDDVLSIFPDSFYENDFGTVGVKTESENESLKVIEVTTFRKEGGYSDFRHPDKIEFTERVEDDLSRRDFTINAMAMSLNGEVVDIYNGKEDLNKKTIKAVGNPIERFEEDALRLIRAIRFAAQLGFDIEEGTYDAIKEKAYLIQNIAKERVQVELSKIVMSDSAAWGVVMLETCGLLEYIIPELREGIGITQNKHHIYTVWDHNLRVFDYACKNSDKLEVRLAALFHDIGKPKVKSGEGEDSTFYNHEIVGAKISKEILKRLKFSNEIVSYTTHLVRNHMFYYNVGEVTEAGVRRFIKRVGEETLDDLMVLREADRIGSGVPKAVPYKIRHLKFMIDKVRRDPISPKALRLDGSELMELLDIPPGRRIGFILNALLEEVIDDPKKNGKEYLGQRARELNEMDDKELNKLFISAKETRQEFETAAEKEIKKKHKV